VPNNVILKNYTGQFQPWLKKSSQYKTNN